MPKKCICLGKPILIQKELTFYNSPSMWYNYVMSRPHRMLFPSTQRKATALGERLRDARLRRRMTETELSNRAQVSRPTIRRLEAGDLTVSFAILASVLEILSLEEDLDCIAERDILGHKLADSQLPPPRRGIQRNLANEL
jgi:transcriptional regulator with XRE-family HTH domain